MPWTRHAERGLSRRAIAVEPAARVIDDELAGVALEEVDGDDEEAAARALVRLAAPRIDLVAGCPDAGQTNLRGPGAQGVPARTGRPGWCARSSPSRAAVSRTISTRRPRAPDLRRLRSRSGRAPQGSGIVRFVPGGGPSFARPTCARECARHPRGCVIWPPDLRTDAICCCTSQQADPGRSTRDDSVNDPGALARQSSACVRSLSRRARFSSPRRAAVRRGVQCDPGGPRTSPRSRTRHAPCSRTPNVATVGSTSSWEPDARSPTAPRSRSLQTHHPRPRRRRGPPATARPRGRLRDEIDRDVARKVRRGGPHGARGPRVDLGDQRPRTPRERSLSTRRDHDAGGERRPRRCAASEAQGTAHLGRSCAPHPHDGGARAGGRDEPRSRRLTVVPAALRTR